MLAAALLDVVARLHAAQAACSVITTGPGATALAALAAPPAACGHGGVLVDARVPRHPRAVAALLDCRPAADGGAAAAAVHFAHTAFATALALERGPEAVLSPDAAGGLVGIGCTAAAGAGGEGGVGTVSFVSSWSATAVRSYRLALPPADGPAEREALVARLVLAALAAAAGCDAPPDALGLPEPAAPSAPAGAPPAAAGGRRLDLVVADPRLRPLRLLLSGALDRVVFNAHGALRCAAPPYTDEPPAPAAPTDEPAAHYLLYPGSFRPLHWGHTELLRAAAAVVRRRRPGPGGGAGAAPAPVVATFEIASAVVDKPGLDEAALAARVAPFVASGRRVALTTAKLFVEKAALFPRHGLVVGLDTAVRVLDPRHYGGDEAAMIAAVRRISDDHGCYFVVGGRQHSGGAWLDLDSVAVPPELKGMFLGIPAADFRVDISSTQIRERRAATPPPPP